jgi:hypothetical protein
MGTDVHPNEHHLFESSLSLEVITVLISPGVPHSYQSVMVIAFSTLSCLPMYFARRSLWYRHDSQRYCHPWAAAVSNTIANAPFVVFDTLLYGLPVYFCTGE